MRDEAALGIPFEQAGSSYEIPRDDGAE